MDIEWLRRTCLSLPATSEEVKWGNDLCFLVADKMFCVAGLSNPLTISFKVPEEQFQELSSSDGFIPAPYLARAKWVQIQELSKVRKEDLEKHIRQSYDLISSKLSKKIRLDLGLT